MHFAHGYLGASFFSPLANQRTDEYGGSLENRLRFHREALDAVRAVWPERLPLTMRLGSDDFNDEGVQFDDAVWAVGDDEGARARPGRPQPRHEHRRDEGRCRSPRSASWSSAAAGCGARSAFRSGVSWNLGLPAVADRVIREELIDLVLLGRPALANPHWPVWAARDWRITTRSR